MCRHVCRCAFLTLSLAAAVALPSVASAWKGPTHVYLAEEVREAMVSAGGTVSVDRTSFWGQQVSGPGALGSYPVNAAVYSALAGHPAYYRAGALGPDAYADLLFGQNTIHPEANTLGGADAWLKLLYANANTPQERAFVLGFISHAASDLFGHTFVNSYNGGEPFALGMNAVRHILVESYIANATPPLRSSSSYTIDTAGVNQFIYDNMIDARRARDGSGTLLWELTRSTRYQTVTGLFTEIRAGLEDNIAGYYDHVDYIRREIKSAARSCGFWNPAACVEQLFWEGYLAVYRAGKGATIIAYEEAWVDDINRGLRAWPATSTAVAQAVFMNPAGADWNAAGAALSAWKDAHLLSMIGLPDVVADIVNAVSDIFDLVAPLEAALHELKMNLLDYMIRKATGQSIAEWMNNDKGSGTDLDRLVPSSTATSTSRQLDQLMAVSGGKFTPSRFAPAFNSMALIKLSFINDTDSWVSLLGRLGWTAGPDVLRQYLAHRQFDASFGPSYSLLSKEIDGYGFAPLPQGLPSFNPFPFLFRGQNLPNYQVVIGYTRSLDGSNQWRPSGGPQPMLLTRDYSHFTSLFMHQRGDCHDDGKCAANPLPAILNAINSILLE